MWLLVVLHTALCANPGTVQHFGPLSVYSKWRRRRRRRRRSRRRRRRRRRASQGERDTERGGRAWGWAPCPGPASRDSVKPGFPSCLGFRPSVATTALKSVTRGGQKRSTPAVGLGAPSEERGAVQHVEHKEHQAQLGPACECSVRKRKAAARHSAQGGAPGGSGCSSAARAIEHSNGIRRHLCASQRRRHSQAGAAFWTQRFRARCSGRACGWGKREQA